MSTTPDKGQFATLDTPTGPFTIVAADDAVLASGWTASVDDLVPLIHPSLRPSTVTGRAELGPFTRAAAAYHAGDLDAIDGVPVRQVSGAFLVHAWDVLRTVPAGAPVTYTEYAAKAGRPGRGAGGGERVRPQRCGALRAVPPGGPRRRLARRLPVGSAGQALAPRPRVARGRVAERASRAPDRPHA
jgi:O6-methylguanine-DNA--protein-cysteine methyltransferase